MFGQRTGRARQFMGPCNLRIFGNGPPLLSCVALLIVVATPGSVSAQPVETFYQGKTINLIIGYPTAGAPDVYARLVARHLGKYIPGNPSIIARNMPGAGSLLAANHIYNVAPRDGTTLGLTAPTLPLEELLGSTASKYKAAQFRWIGRLATNPNVTFVMNSSQVKTIADAFDKVAILSATGRSSTNAVYPTVLNNVLGTKFKIVTGYEGTAAAMLAMEWLETKRVNVLVQYLLKRHPDLPDVPTAVELARTPEQEMILRVVTSASEIGKFIFTTPEVPLERVAGMRQAFDAMVRDRDFVAEAEKLRIEIDPIPGTELQHIVQQLQSTPSDVVDKVRPIYPLN
jgi:tripartite-type tricarboxylate transporter receptor subunit TctC